MVGKFGLIILMVGCSLDTETNVSNLVVEPNDPAHCVPVGDTAADIQACVDQVSTGPTGGVVELRAQFYFLETMVTVSYPYVVIRGQGNGATTIYSNWGGVAFSFETCFSCGLENLLVYSTASGESVMGIMTRKVDEFRVNNVNLRLDNGVGLCLQNTNRSSFIDLQVWADRPVVYLYGQIEHVNYHNSVLIEFGGDHPLVEVKPEAVVGNDVTFSGFKHHHDNQ